ncbi:MAG: YbaN family protein [Planctomycetota bacterium]
MPATLDQAPPRRPTVSCTAGEVRVDGLSGGDSDAAALAGRLLTTDEVRSVTINRRASAATVQLRDASAGDATIAGITSLVAGAHASLTRSTDRIAAPDILCWRDNERHVDSYFRAPEMATGWRRWMHLAGAAITFALAAIGVVLPGLPTTPFLLLTSYCLLRSSRRLHTRLLRSRVFGPLLRDWHTHRGVRPGVKTKSLAVLIAVVGATVLLSGLPARALVGIVACSMIGVVCICRLRVITDA